MSSLSLTPTHDIELTLTDANNSVTIGSVGDGLLLGLQAIVGADANFNGALAIMNRLSEFDTTQAKADAVANLGIAVVDGGTF